jgi:hypothetical protein
MVPAFIAEAIREKIKLWPKKWWRSLSLVLYFSW